MSIALVTGTLTNTVIHVLQNTGLGKFFPVKVTGEEGLDRIDLVEKVIDVAEKYYGHAFELNRIVAIGDSANDILAARATGIRSIAVATGNSSLEELKNYVPNVLLPNLSNFESVLQAIFDERSNVI